MAQDATAKPSRRLAASSTNFRQRIIECDSRSIFWDHFPQFPGRVHRRQIDTFVFSFNKLATFRPFVGAWLRGGWVPGSLVEPPEIQDGLRIDSRMCRNPMCPHFGRLEAAGGGTSNAISGLLAVEAESIMALCLDGFAEAEALIGELSEHRRAALDGVRLNAQYGAPIPPPQEKLSGNQEIAHIDGQSAGFLSILVSEALVNPRLMPILTNNDGGAVLGRRTTRGQSRMSSAEAIEELTRHKEAIQERVDRIFKLRKFAGADKNIGEQEIQGALLATMSACITLLKERGANGADLDWDTMIGADQDE